VIDRCTVAVVVNREPRNGLYLVLKKSWRWLMREKRIDMLPSQVSV